MHKNFRFALIPLLLFASCNLFKKPEIEGEHEGWVFMDDGLDSVSENWTGSKEILVSEYRASRDKVWDLEHTELSLQFNFEKRSAFGTAELTLKPHWTAASEIILDARSMVISGIFEVEDTPGINPEDKKTSPLRYAYSDSAHLHVFLNREWNKDEHLKIRIEYASNSYKIKGKGTEAIQDDRGLYFINHDLGNPFKPRQIWSQGETQSNSCWFPTIDAPNQKTTLGIKLFVPDTMVTLSNGKLVKSIPSPTPGIRMDYWQQNLPHAPYLTMIAVGNWAVVKDKWRDKEVNYLVEKDYEPYAKLIFGNTPSMIEFFSNYLGTPFPWDKYSQVVVRDFVSGAMENTSATVHMEELQHTNLEHLDNSYEDYISHELFHQWFGDLVTTESWSNITLNESSATYGQYLWREYFYGRSNADALLAELRKEYDYAGTGAGKDLVRYTYGNEGELFDNISYQKGACILHMLRYAVGDDIFRESLKRYLNQNAYKTAEVANLRMAFEEVSGRDLNWFFNQWYFDSDHPKIQMELHRNELDSHYILRIQQTQENRNCYAFPVRIEYRVNNTTSSKNIFVKYRNQEIDLGKEKPDYYIFDADNSLLDEEQFILSGLADAQDDLNMINIAMAHNKLLGSQYKLFLIAEKITGEFEESMLDDSMKIAMKKIFKKAMGSGFDPLLERALNYSVTHPWVLEFTGSRTLPDFENIPANYSLKTDTRISAINSLYYAGYSDEKLAEYISDSNITVSAFIIGRLRNKEMWEPMAKEQIQKNIQPKIAIAWVNKLVWYEGCSASQGLLMMTRNSNLQARDFYKALDVIIYEMSEEKQAQQLDSLITGLQNEKKIIFERTLRSRLVSEILKLPVDADPENALAKSRNEIFQKALKRLNN